MRRIYEDFKRFITRGNVFDLAIAFIMGLAFKTLIDAFIAFIINPLIGAIGGKPTLDDLTVTIGKGVVAYGAFIGAVINFLTIALALFVIVETVKRMRELRGARGEPEELSDEAELLREIRDLLAVRG